MTKKQEILLAVFCILLFAVNLRLWIYGLDKESSYNVDSLIIVNDSLYNKSEELRFSIDSLKNKSSKVDSVIIEVEKKYEKDLVNITNQSCASDVLFFTKYLSKNSTRFLNSNNSTTIEAN